MNIGSKLILSFLVVTLLPTILLAILTTAIIGNSKKDDAQETINNNLRAAWMQYYARAYQMQYGMLQASTEEHIKNAIKRRDQEFLRRQLQAWKEYRPYVDLWSIVDAESVTIASNNTSASGFRLSFNGLVEKSLQSRESFISTEVVPFEVLEREGVAALARVAITPETVAEKSSRRELTDGMMLVVVTPVTDIDGRVIGGIITGDLINNDTFVSDTLAESIPGSLVTIAMDDVQIATNVVDESGQRTTGHLLGKDVLASINRNVSYRGEAFIATKDYIAAFDPIVNNAGEVIGSLFVGVPKERFVELKYENMKAITSIALIAFFLATGVASFITYMFTRPITSLTKKAQAVSTGNLNVQTGSLKNGNDEIAELARAFDIMVKSLRENEERIKVSQDKLAQQKNLIESIINSLPYCLYVIEKNLVIAAWNRHSKHRCPICNSGEDCYNRHFIPHLPHDELKDGLEDVLTGVFATGEPRQLEQKITGAAQESGKDIFLRTSIFPIRSERGGPVDYVVWMAEDITKKKEMEASVLSSEKLAAIGQLAAGIAHEVNNPLGGILNCLYNFKNRKLTEERKDEYLDFMEDGIKRVQNIVRQLLDFSQQHAPELTHTNVNSIIEGLVPLFLHSIKDRDIRLVRDLGNDLPIILADRHQIEQIIVNLMLNAVQAVDGDGVIEIATRVEGPWYCIQVSDNGMGIDPENMPRIFDPFFTTKGVGQGTGLGLSVSRGIIERHKGRIEVDSNSSAGTTFRVYLPVVS